VTAFGEMERIRSYIFGTDEDRTAFLSLMSSNLQHVGYKCYAWALMTNHYHLVLRASDRPLADLMRPLNAEYARTYGKRHGRPTVRRSMTSAGRSRRATVWIAKRCFTAAGCPKWRTRERYWRT
jgi:REP element-mobilizing transposase RayT